LSGVEFGDDRGHIGIEVLRFGCFEFVLSIFVVALEVIDLLEGNTEGASASREAIEILIEETGGSCDLKTPRTS
jgi:hypothetical protein